MSIRIFKITYVAHMTHIFDSANLTLFLLFRYAFYTLGAPLFICHLITSEVGVAAEHIPGV